MKKNKRRLVDNPSTPAQQLAANTAHRRKAALAPRLVPEQHDSECVHGARAPPTSPAKARREHRRKYLASAKAPTQHLLDRHEICGITNVSYPTVWEWMRANKFPRSRIVGGKSMWLWTEVKDWLDRLPIRRLKGDGEKAAAAAEVS